MEVVPHVIFWISVAGLAYIFAGYPLLVFLLGRLFGQPTIRDERNLPKVSIVIGAYNEAARIVAKLESLFQSVNAECIQEVLIGSDGSDDTMVQVLRQYPDSRVKVFEFPTRRGKPAVLNDLVPMCQADIVLLADSRQLFDSRAIQQLLANFADPTVGVVSGELMLRTDETTSTAGQGIGFYWKYEKFIRKSESRFRGVPGATGAIYAIRKALFAPIPEDTLLDDVVIPMQAVAQGYRCLFEPNAIAFDEPSKSTSQESIRKRRTIAGAAQLIRLRPEWLLPWRNPIWLEFISHKLCRLISPFLLLLAIVSNLLLIHEPIYQFLFVGQILMYLTGGLGWFCQKIGRRSRIFGPALMFLSLNWTTVLALMDACRSKYRVTWQKSGS